MKYNAFFVLPIVLCLLVSPTIGGQNRVSKSLAIRAAQEYTSNLKNDTILSASLLQNNPVLFSRSVVDTLLVEEVSVTDSAKLFLVPSEIGWFLVSPSLEITPVLAYFPTMDKPDIAKFPPELKELIGTYEILISRYNKSPIATQSVSVHNGWRKVISHETTQATRISIAPLLKNSKGEEILWSQTTSGSDCEKSYNKYCPTISDAADQCNKAAVGCVAVAIAQIMWYWKWPYMAKVPTTIGGKNYTLRSYDWDKMPLRLGWWVSTEEADEVAKFLRDCGYQLDMDYGKSSGASDEDALSALKMFGYNPNTMKIVKKINTEGWSSMFYDELAAGRPVYYAGFSTIFKTDGHAFVLNGYDANNDTYYINLGWGYGFNGYFKLDHIPAGEYAFDYYQSAIVGIEPVCAAQTYSAFPAIESPYRIANSEDIGLSLTIPADKTLTVCSGSQVRLSNGFAAKAGSNVRIAAVSDMVCPTERVANKVHTRNLDDEEQYQIKDFEDIMNISETLFQIMPNPVADVLHIVSSENIVSADIYSSTGQLLLRSAEKDIDVSSIARGTYILHTQTDTGMHHKVFIKQ